MYPTPENPLILNYLGRIPALKNNRNKVEIPKYEVVNGQKTLVGLQTRFVPNKTVTQFLRSMETSLQEQVKKQPFTRMAFPCKVAAWVDVTFALKTSHGIPTSDGDNAYTTIQETWQSPEEPSGLADVIDNDRQILSASFDVRVTPNKALQGATAYIWLQPDGVPYRTQVARFIISDDARRRSNKEDFVALPASVLEALFDTTLQSDANESAGAGGT